MYTDKTLQFAVKHIISQLVVGRYSEVIWLISTGHLFDAIQKT